MLCPLCKKPKGEITYVQTVERCITLTFLPKGGVVKRDIDIITATPPSMVHCNDCGHEDTAEAFGLT